MAIPRKALLTGRRLPTRGQLLPVALSIIGIAAVVLILFPSEIGDALQLPLLALYSTTRMFAAFALSIIFAVSYGTAAATNKRAGEILIPILDILQSVPILAFFPPAVLFFIGAFHGSPIGQELAMVFLIFTSMSWNMAFAVYEALTTLPHDLQDASSVFGLREWMRFRRLMLPATIPKLVYNSMLSWTVGWFYLIASEVIQAQLPSGSKVQYVRPGIGSFIYNSGQAGNVPAVIVGIGGLTIVVLLLDTFLWRPLSVWSERFHMETTAGGEISGASRVAAGYQKLRWLPRLTIVRKSLARAAAPLARGWAGLSAPWDRYYTHHAKTIRAFRFLDLILFMMVLALILVIGVSSLVGVLQRPLPSSVTTIPIALASSLLRLALAYGISLAWTIPVAVWVVRSERASRLATPFFEVVASIPATALFPAIIALSVLLVGEFGLEAQLAALVVAVFAMQWYLLFNVIAGMRSVPGDMRDAAQVFGLHGWAYWKRVLLPAVMPSLLTGSITAWGAGWNALIVAEFISFGRTTYSVPGIGNLIAYATYTNTTSAQAASDLSELLLLSVLALVIVVVTMNKLLWRPLIKRASLKYRMELQ